MSQIVGNVPFPSPDFDDIKLLVVKIYCCTMNKRRKKKKSKCLFNIMFSIFLLCCLNNNNQITGIMENSRNGKRETKNLNCGKLLHVEAGFKWKFFCLTECDKFVLIIFIQTHLLRSLNFLIPIKLYNDREERRLQTQQLTKSWKVFIPVRIGIILHCSSSFENFVVF